VKSARHRGRDNRKRRGSKKRRKKGDKAKNGKQVTLVVMYTLKTTTAEDGTPLLQGPINRRVYASYARKRHAFAIARRMADKRGFTAESGKMVQIVTDGDEDLERYAEEFFPEAIHTLDVMHAVEYLWKAGACLFREGSDELQEWVEQRKEQLYSGKIEEMPEIFDESLGHLWYEWKCARERGEKAIAHLWKRYERLDKIANYLDKRVKMMSYDELRKMDLELGSGMVEGAVRYVVSQRFDEGGMRWIKERAEHLLQLRCIELNGHWEDFLAFAHARVVHEQRSSHRSQKILRKVAAPLPTYGLAS